MKPELQPGLTHEITEETLESHAAPHLAANGKFLFSTPSMIGFMERCSVQLITPYLDEGEGSVGYHVNVFHLAATPIGQKVRVRSTVQSIDPPPHHVRRRGPQRNREDRRRHPCPRRHPPQIGAPVVA